MKTNFQETIKQKTDTELKTISKDYAFYSEEERLIALNELEMRNGLSKELLTCKNNIEASIEEPIIITEQAREAVALTKRIYKDRAIWVGAVFGGTLVAGYLIAENFKAFNEIDKARKTWIYSIIGTILICSGAILMPDDIHAKIPNSIIPLLYGLIAALFVHYFQRRNISAYLALGGKPFGWGRIIIVSLIGVVINLVLLFILAIILIKD